MRKTIYSGTDAVSASNAVNKAIAAKVRGIKGKVAVGTNRASNELRNAALYVLRGQRSGRVYRVPFTKKKYTASAPGESPAVRTGIFRLSWGIHNYIKKNGTQFEAIASIESNIKAGKYLLGDILENGTGKMAKRPYKQKVKNMAMPKIREIFKNL